MPRHPATAQRRPLLSLDELVSYECGSCEEDGALTEVIRSWRCISRDGDEVYEGSDVVGSFCETGC